MLISLWWKLVSRVFLVLFGGVLVNWIFVIWRGKAIRQMDWWMGGVWWVIISVLVIVLLVVVFPFLYIWNLKWSLVQGVISTVWCRYHTECTLFIVRRLSKWLATQSEKLQDTGGYLAEQWKNLFVGLSWILRKILEYVKQQLPLLEHLELAIEHIDREQSKDPVYISQQMMQDLQPRLEEQKFAKKNHTMTILLVVNGLLLLGVWGIIKYV